MLQDHYKNTNAVFLAHGYVGEILGKFDQHLSEAIKYLGGAVERLQETQEEISEEIEQLRKLR